MKASAHWLLVTTVSAAILLSHAGDAEARGRGGFSRGGVAASGSLSSSQVADAGVARGNVDGGRVAQGGALPARSAGQLHGARNAGDIRQPRDARSASGARQPQGASSPAGVGETRSLAGTARVTAAAPAVRDASPEEMARYRAQFARDNAGVDNDRWDRPPPVDPGYGVPVRGAGLVAGTIGVAIAREDALDYAEKNNGTDYYAELPCAVQGNLEQDGSTYYRCDNGWYKRAMRGDDIVFIRVDAPPGF